MLLVVSPVQALFDVGVRVGVARHVNALRVTQQVACQAADVACKSSAEHHRLARRRGGSCDVVDVVNEAHVEHAVGFVQN